MGRFGDKLVSLNITPTDMPQYFAHVYNEMSNRSAQCWDVDPNIRLIKAERLSPTEAKFTTITPLNDEIYVELTLIEEKGLVTAYWRVNFEFHQTGSGMVVRVFKIKFKKSIIAALEYFAEKYFPPK